MSINKNMGAQDYEQLKKKQLQLAGIANQAKAAAEVLNMSQYSENLSKMKDKIENDSFKIQIVGTFKNGKSTFINSFLGEEILPAYTLPCTAVINEVKYGSEKRAILHFRNPLPDVFPNEIPDKALNHMRKHNMHDIPPLEIPYDEIESYVVIPIGKEVEEAIKESPYEKVELFWPMDLLKNGVEIVDSPGLDEDEVRTKVTMDYLTKADAIIFLLRVDRLCGQKEMEFVQYSLKGNGFENPFFVISRFDMINSEREKQQIKTYTYSKLRDYTTFGENGFYFVSALNALEGKVNSDLQKYQSSGMPEFEKRLSQFLTKERGVAKLSQPAKELKRILGNEALDKIIPQQRALLETSLDEVKARYENVKPRLEDLQKKKEILKESIDTKISTALPEIKKCVLQNYSDLASSVRTWSREFVIKTKIGFIPKKDNISAATEEVTRYITEQIESNQLEWKNNTLTPLINDKISEIFGTVESDVKRLFDEIDSINLELSGNHDVNTENDVPTWQRVVGTVGGFVLGGPALAQSGNMFGIGKEFAKTLAIEVGAFALLSAFSLLNPVTMIGTVVVLIIRNFGKGESKVTEKIKDTVADEMIKQLNSQKDASVDKIVGEIDKELSQLSDTITSSVDIEINEVNNQVQEVIAEMEKGQANIDARKAELCECEQQVKQLISNTDDFIMDLIS